MPKVQYSQIFTNWSDEEAVGTLKPYYLLVLVIKLQF